MKSFKLQTLVNAIVAGKTCSINYKGHARTIDPYVMYTPKDSTLVHAWELTKDNEPTHGWRLYKVEHIESLNVMGDSTLNDSIVEYKPDSLMYRNPIIKR